MPPPLELMPQSVFHEEEPIKTGAPIAFIQVDKFNGGKTRNEEALSAPKEDKKPQKVFEVDLKPEVAEIRAKSANI